MVATKSQVRSLPGVAQGKKILGWTMWWSIEGGLLVTAAKIKSSFGKYGFDEKEFPEVMSHETALTRAITRAGFLREFSGWIIRRIIKSKERTVIAVVRETVDEKKEDADYDSEDRLTLTRTSGTLELVKGIPKAKDLKTMFESFKDKLDNWGLSAYLVRIMVRTKALQLRDRGGIYFIPNAPGNEELLRKIEGAIESLSPSTILYLLPIYEDARSQKALQNAFNEDFDTELKTVSDQMKKFIEKESDREFSYKSRLDLYKGIRERAKMYEDLLSFKAQAIHKKIDDMEKSVKAAMLKVE